MTPEPLSTLHRARDPVAAAAARLKPARPRTNSGVTPWAGLTRPAAPATPHPSSGPEDRNGQDKPSRDDAAIAGDNGRVPDTGVVATLDSASIEAIALRVVALLADPGNRQRATTALIDAGELARRTGISRTWIYQHADKLGAIRLGNGPKARLRFNPDTVEHLLSSETPPPAPTTVRSQRRRAVQARTDIDLLPIKKNTPRMSHLGLLRRRSH